MLALSPIERDPSSIDIFIRVRERTHRAIVGLTRGRDRDLFGEAGSN